MSKTPNEIYHPKPLKHAQDFRLVQKVLEGRENSVFEFQKEYRPMLERVLMSKGLNKVQAEDVVADIMAECFGAGKKGATTSLLGKFEGRSALSSWLVTVTWRRWLDLKRREQRIVDLPEYVDDDFLGDKFDRLPAAPEELIDEDLGELMRSAIKAAFASLEPDTLLMLKLSCLHGISQIEIARMWRIDQTRVSRLLAAARTQIGEVTMRELKAADPDLRIEWEDFKLLCEVGIDW